VKQRNVPQFDKLREQVANLLYRKRKPSEVKLRSKKACGYVASKKRFKPEEEVAAMLQGRPCP